MCVRMPCSLHHLFTCTALLAKRNILSHSQVEQNNLLTDQSHLRPKIRDAQVAQVVPIQFDRAGIGIMKTEQQINERALAGATLTDNPQLGPLGHGEVEISQHFLLLVSK